MVRMALLPPLPTIRSISQSPNLLPSASGERSCMLTLSGMLRTFVFRRNLIWRRYFRPWRQWERSSPLPSESGFGHRWSRAICTSPLVTDSRISASGTSPPNGEAAGPPSGRWGQPHGCRDSDTDGTPHSPERSASCNDRSGWRSC